MHQLWQHRNGVYYVLHGPRLKKRVSTRLRDRSKAETFLSQFIAAQAGLAPDDPTVRVILEGYRDDKLPVLRGKDGLKFAVAALLPHVGDLLPAHLTPLTMKQYARKRAEEGVGAGTILRETGVLRAAMSWAVEHKWIATRPIISNPVKQPPSRERWITKDEARRLVASCESPHVKLFVMLGLMTVARMSAILEAKWDQVDFERKIIHYGQGHGNKRRAVVPLNDELLRALQAAKEFSCSDYVIEYHGGPVKTVKNGFRQACDRAALKDVTPHILRHSGATWMIEDGIPEEEVARMLGDTIAMVRRVYGHHSPSYLKRAAGALQFTTEVA